MVMNALSAGRACTAAAALLFFWLCMVLPLVGRAARLTDHYGKNLATFAVFLALALGLAFQARRLLLRAHREGLAPYPRLAAGLFWLYVAMAVLLVTGRFHQ
jgi:hypothetical protein